MRSPLERYAGSLAVASADLGARLALSAVTELLYEVGMNEAAELVNDHGDAVVARSFSEAAWSSEQLPTAGQAEPTTTTSTTGKHHG